VGILISVSIFDSMDLSRSGYVHLFLSIRYKRTCQRELVFCSGHVNLSAAVTEVRRT